jgi:hypothetical protein
MWHTLKPEVLRVLIYRSILGFSGLDSLAGNGSEQVSIMKHAGLMKKWDGVTPYEPYSDRIFHFSSFCLHCKQYWFAGPGLINPLITGCRNCLHYHDPLTVHPKPFWYFFPNWKGDWQIECIDYLEQQYKNVAWKYRLNHFNSTTLKGNPNVKN